MDLTGEAELNDSVSAENTATEGKFFPFLLPAAMVGRLIESYRVKTIKKFKKVKFSGLLCNTVVHGQSLSVYRYARFS